MALVTILVPIYNVEEYVAKCLESLIHQTYEDIEIWAVIDGSPDNSEDIVKQYREKDKRIQCIKKENGGYGSVLEYGANHIESKYFMVCDPDDWLTDDAVEVLLKKAERDNLDIVVANKWLAYEDGHLSESTLNEKYYELEAGKVYMEDVEKFAFLQSTPHAKLFRTDIVRDICFPHKISCTDFILYMISLKNSERVMYLEDKLAYYFFDRTGNTQTDKSLKAIDAHIRVWESVYDQITESNKYIIFRLYRELKVIFYVYLMNSDKLFKDEFYSRILVCIGSLDKYKKCIENGFTRSLVSRIECQIIFSKGFAFREYLRIRKFLHYAKAALQSN